MNPTIGYHLAQAYLADRRHQAQRDTPARGCPPAPPRTSPPARASRARTPVRRLLTVLGAPR